MKPVVATLLLACTALPLQAQTITFTKQQVDAGQALYKEICQLCHGTTLANAQFATPLKGEAFQDKWKGKTVGELLTFVYEKMPPDKLKSLSTDQYNNAVAFILSKNGISATDTALDTKQSSVLLPW